MRLSLIIEGELDTLYHGTRQELLPNILKIGLDPMMSEYADDEEQINFDPPYHFVFLAWTFNQAAAFVPGGDYSKDPDPTHRAMFEIRLPHELQDKLILNRGEFIRCPFLIKPQYLRVIK